MSEFSGESSINHVSGADVQPRFKIGDRVRVTSYAGGFDNHYVGLAGTIAYVRDESLFSRVILDDDPTSLSSASAAGLPVEDDEIEKIDG